MSYQYPEAGLNAQPEVVSAVRRYRTLPIAQADKEQSPLLYWLLGSGTPPYKLAKPDALYGRPRVRGQNCGNCSSAYQQVTSGDFICSQVSGSIRPEAWCRVWNLDRN